MNSLTAHRVTSVYWNKVSQSLQMPAIAIVLLIALPAAAAAQAPNGAAVNKLALNAYCTVAQKESSSLADGKVSYKQVADAASTQALAEHPNVYRDSFAWKAKIVALLDQYGDEPIGQLCSEDPGSHASAND